jgi:aspartate ammonia-lyase
LQILNNSLRVFTERCVRGITAQADRCRSYAEGTLALVTALNPYIGYLQAAEVAKISLETGKPIRQIVLERNLMSPEQVAKALNLEAMSQMRS